MLWAYANGIAPYVDFADSPIWFVFLLLLIPHWQGVYFYWTHRMLHIPALYQRIHRWHHKNVNTGPWSGLAMHPVEQIILLADSLVFLLIASHPVHVICQVQSHLVTAPSSHTGFEAVKLTDKHNFRLGDYFHHLHHRFFECNYGTTDTPWDKWFGTFHDGSGDAEQKMIARRNKLHSPG